MLDVLFSPYIVIPALLLKVVCSKLFRGFKLEAFILTIGYFFWLIFFRGGKATFQAGHQTVKHVRRVKRPLSTPKVAHLVSELNIVYRMKGLEVILGMDKYHRPIRVDLNKYHTLIAGITGSGKTMMLNMIIAQLVGRGSRFFSEYDLYIVDLKNDEKDYLSCWKGVVTGYYSIDENGSTESAILALRDIVNRIHRHPGKKQTVVIIDELAMLTSQAPTTDLRKKGDAVLQRLAAQLRSSGALIVATQRPHFDTIGRGVSGNLDRKICLRVDDNSDSARLVLRHKPRVDATNLRNGEFILKEPGVRDNERVARTMLMNLPGEIDAIIYSVMADKIEQDERLKLFAQIAANIKRGSRVPGVQQMRKTTPNWTLTDLQDAYWNYVRAGAFVNSRTTPDGRATQRLLAEEFPDAVGLVHSYIRQGRWKASPRKNGNDEEEL